MRGNFLITPALRHPSLGKDNTYAYIEETIVPKLAEFGRPISWKYVYKGEYADRELFIEIVPEAIIMVMSVEYCRNYNRECFSSRMMITLPQFVMMTKDWFDNSLNQMYSHIGTMIEEYNNKGDFSN